MNLCLVCFVVGFLFCDSLPVCAFFLCVCVCVCVCVFGGWGVVLFGLSFLLFSTAAQPFPLLQ